MKKRYDASIEIKQITIVMTKHDFLAKRFHAKDISSIFDKCRYHEEEIAQRKSYDAYLRLQLSRIGWSSEEVELLVGEDRIKMFFDLTQAGIAYQKWFDTSIFFFSRTGGYA